MEHPPVVLHTRPALEMDEEQFFEFCQLNRDWRIERSAEGNLEIIMVPAGGETSNRTLKLSVQLGNWTDRNDTGVAFHSNGDFILPNGAIRSPDASWVRRERLVNLTAEQKQKFLPLCPDFVLELRSPSDPLGHVEAKMREYMENGAPGLAHRPRRVQGPRLQARRASRDPGQPRQALRRPRVARFRTRPQADLGT